MKQLILFTLAIIILTACNPRIPEAVRAARNVQIVSSTPNAKSSTNRDATAQALLAARKVTPETAAAAAMKEDPYRALEEALRASPFATDFFGFDSEGIQVVVLVEGSIEAVESYLLDAGFPPSRFIVRSVNVDRLTLHRAEQAATNWLENSFDGGFGIGVVEPENTLTIMVEAQPFVKMSGLEPQNQPIPYDQWPESLQAALAEFVPKVNIELYAGFELIDTQSE